METYLTQEQFDTLGATELETIQKYGFPELVKRYKTFLVQCSAEYCWRELCDHNNQELEFDEHVYFKTWLIIYSVIPAGFYLKQYAYFRDALTADYYWQTHTNAPAGQLAELFANLTPEEPCHN